MAVGQSQHLTNHKRDSRILVSPQMVLSCKTMGKTSKSLQPFMGDHHPSNPVEDLQASQDVCP